MKIELILVLLIDPEYSAVLRIVGFACFQSALFNVMLVFSSVHFYLFALFVFIRFKCCGVLLLHFLQMFKNVVTCLVNRCFRVSFCLNRSGGDKKIFVEQSQNVSSIRIALSKQ